MELQPLELALQMANWCYNPIVIGVLTDNPGYNWFLGLPCRNMSLSMTNRGARVV